MRFTGQLGRDALGATSVGHRTVQAMRRTTLAAALAVALLGVTSTASAASFYWYGENDSTCWQEGQPGSPSPDCREAVGEWFLNSSPPVRTLEGALDGNLALTESGDYCNAYNLNEGHLYTRDSSNESGLTGFNPSPADTMTDGHGDVCQAIGAQWGQGLRPTAADKYCVEPNKPKVYEPCGMQHYVSFVSQKGSLRPWGDSFGAPSLVVEGAAYPGKVNVPGGAWAYLCPILEQVGSTHGDLLEYCFVEWQTGDYNPLGKVNQATESGDADGHIMNQVMTAFQLGTSFSTKIAGSGNSYTYGEHPWIGPFKAAITGEDLEAAIKAANTKYGTGYSENLAEYALIGVEQGIEGEKVTELGEKSEDLKLYTEYTPLPPEATTNAASGLQPVQATLNGTVNPKATDTHYYFQYGPTTSYGLEAPASPGTDAGSGTSTLPVSTTATRLQPNTYYHYRLVATNSLGTTVYGADKTFTTQVEQSGSSWAQRETSTQETWLYIPDSSAGVSAWYWDDGWSESSLASLAGKTKLTAEDEIAPGTVPTTLREPSTSETWVYFQNKNHGISAWGWFPGVGWTVTELPKASLPEGESEAAAGTSPTATREPSTSATWVYFQNKQGGISAFEWSPGVGWTESVLPGSKKEEAAPGASPTVIREPGTQEAWVYFPNRTAGVSAWYWKAGAGWSVTELPKTKLPEGESEVAGGTSPTVVREPSTSETWVYFQNKQGGISAFDWAPGVGWGEMVLPGSKEEVASGTSPSVVREPSTSETWVYFQNKNHGISAWYWNDGWSVMELPGGKGEAAVTASPTVLREDSNAETWVYFENKAGGMSGFNWSIEGKGWHLGTL